MSEYLSPGVYVQEFDSGIHAMQGVGTSTAGFLGYAERGPASGAPKLVTSFADFQRFFGGYLPRAEYVDNCYLPYAVELFFANGGTRCYVSRLLAPGAKAAACSITKDFPALDKNQKPLLDAEKKPVMEPRPLLTVTAAGEGGWGNQLVVTLAEGTGLKTTLSAAADDTHITLKSASGLRSGDLLLFHSVKKPNEKCYAFVESIVNNEVVLRPPAEGANHAELSKYVSTSAVPEHFVSLCVLKLTAACGEKTEVYEDLTLNPDGPDYIESRLAASELLRLCLGADFSLAPGALLPQFGASAEAKSLVLRLSGGLNGNASEALTKQAVQGSSTVGARTGLAAFEDLTDVNLFAVPGCAVPEVQALLIAHCESSGAGFAILDAKLSDTETTALTAYKDRFDTSYAALYHPWLSVYSAAEKKPIFVPPSGAVAGVYARTDGARGVWKAPANEVVRCCTALSANYSAAEQGVLNPKGINLIRALPGQGIRVWGARTLSSDGNWKYVNVRRLFIYIEESIRQSTGWAVFEPNDTNLWSRVSGTVHVFLTGLWREGALAGAAPEEAFYVSIGRGVTMTEDDILNGRLICEIGVAPVRPAEFIIFRITQKMLSEQ